jgi:regulator of RNase E activity RraA
VQDTNNKPVGCFWGEVQTNIHKSMGFKGVVTNGAIRDVHMAAKNFQMLAKQILPSHAYEKFLSFGKKINVCGVDFKHDDIIHADQHGVVKIPIEYLKDLPKAVKQVLINEKPILDMCKKKKFTLEKLLKIVNKETEYH